MFKGIVLNKTDAGVHAELKELDDSMLDTGNVRVRVRWSPINYKDVMAITGTSPIAKRFSLIPITALVMKTC